LRSTASYKRDRNRPTNFDAIFMATSTLPCSRPQKVVRAVCNAISSRRPRVVVADDSTVAREGIAAIVCRDSRFTLCGLAADQQTTSDLLEQHQPDLLLIEPFLGNRDGIFFIKELAARFSDMRILVISRQPEEIYAERALRAGASGYWMKTGSQEELIRAIDTVLAGELYVSSRIALRAVHEVVEQPAARPNAPNLTDRELHVFALTGAGLGTSRIAQELGISPKTVETYHEHIKLKLGYADADALHKGAREWFELSHRK
jgi:DNA-binding NarL/FixJ family response regulator